MGSETTTDRQQDHLKEFVASLPTIQEIGSDTLPATISLDSEIESTGKAVLHAGQFSAYYPMDGKALDPRQKGRRVLTRLDTGQGVNVRLERCKLEGCTLGGYHYDIHTAEA